MGIAYTPGLEATDFAEVTKLRELPLPGRVLVNLGDTVRADTPVLSAELPGDLEVLRISERTGLEPSEIAQILRVKDGDKLERGQLILEKRYLFGLFATRFYSPISGSVEFFTDANAHLGVRGAAEHFSINAYVDGVVTRIEEGKAVEITTRGAHVQGIFGVGGERRGEIVPYPIANDQRITADNVRSQSIDLRGKVIVGGRSAELLALKELANSGITALVTGSIDSTTLSDFVGYEIGVSMTGDEELPFTLIVTEGFGDLAISPRIVELAQRFSGAPCSVNGATQVRAGAVRPELIINHGKEGSSASVPNTNSGLNVGTRIRCIRAPYFGRFGTIIELPSSPTVVESGAELRVLKAQLDNEGIVTVPRANVEIVSG